MDFTYSMPAASPEQLMPPPSASPKSIQTFRYTKPEWEVHRALIEEHHMDLKYTDLVDLLKEKGFYVSKKQLKDRLKSWGHGKNVRGPEMKAIVRKQAQRRAQGKESRIRVRGKRVPESTIIRWQKRQESEIPADNMEVFSSASTPSNISVSTPMSIASPFPDSTSFEHSRTFESSAAAAVTSTISVNLQPGYSQGRGGRPRQPVDENYVVTDLLTFLQDYDETFDGVSEVLFTIPTGSESTRSSLHPFPNLDIIEAYPAVHDVHGAQGRFQMASIDGPNYEINHGTSFDVKQHGLATRPFVSTATGPQKRHRDDEEKQLSEQMMTYQRDYGPTHPATLNAASKLSEIYRNQYRLDFAETLYRQRARNLLVSAGDNNAETLITFAQLSSVFRISSRNRLAESLCRFLHSKVQIIEPTSGVARIFIKNSLASCCFDLVLYNESEQLFREAIREGRSVLPPNADQLLYAMQLLAAILADRNEYAEAEKIIRVTLQALDLNLAQNSLPHFEARSMLGELLYLGGNPTAESVLRVGVKDSRKELGLEHPTTLKFQVSLALNLCKSHRWAEGTPLLQDCITIHTKSKGENDSEKLRTETLLAEALVQQDKFSPAKELAEKVLMLLKSKAPGVAPHIGVDGEIASCAMQVLAMCYRGQGQLEKAAEILEHVLERMRATHHERHWLMTKCAGELKKVRRDVQLRDSRMIWERDTAHW